MCFWIHNDHAEAKIAEEDIVCYKVITNFDRSLHYFYYYKPNTTYEYVELQKLISYWPDDMPSIEKGYHSYSTYKFALRGLVPWMKVVKFIIPKGTEYYYNPDHNEYVSSVIRSGDLVNYSE